MTDQQAQAQPPPVGPADVAADAAVPALINALEQTARKAAGDDRAAEVKDYAAACLALAQSIVTLDASRLAGGDTPGGRKSSMPDPNQGGGTRPRLPATKDGNRDGVIG
jgi:hypothetical protein